MITFLFWHWGEWHFCRSVLQVSILFLPVVATNDGALSHNWLGNWDLDLVLNCLAVLLGDLLGHLVAADGLLGVAVGDRDLLGGLLGSVDAHLLGDLTAVRLDGGVAGGLGNSRNLDGWGHLDSVGSWGGVTSRVSAIGATVSTDGVSVDACSPGISLSLPLDDAMLDDMSGSTVLGGHFLALLLVSDGLLLNLLGVALLLSLWDTVLGLNFLIGDGALWSGDGGLVGGHFDGWPGHSHWGHSHWSVDGGWGSGGVSAVSSDGASVASVGSPGVGLGGGGSVGHGGGHAGIGDKLVHGDLDFGLTSHEELSS